MHASGRTSGGCLVFRPQPQLKPVVAKHKFIKHKVTQCVTMMSITPFALCLVCFVFVSLVFIWSNWTGKRSGWRFSVPRFWLGVVPSVLHAGRWRQQLGKGSDSCRFASFPYSFIIVSLKAGGPASPRMSWCRICGMCQAAEAASSGHAHIYNA